MCYRPFVQGRCGSGSSLFCVGASPRCWGSIREQENGLFLTTEMGQQGQFFENLPCWIFLLALPNPFLRFWAGIILLTLIAKYSYNEKVRIRAEKWPSGRRRLTRNQLSGLPFREFESHLLRHFYFQESLTQSKTPLMSGVFLFCLSVDAHPNML